MNWLDIAFLVVLAGAGYIGLKNGLLGMIVGVVALYLGWTFGSQFALLIAGLIDDDPERQSWIGFIVYGVIMAASLAGAAIVWRVIRPLLKFLTVGLSALVDRLGGLAMGLLLGLLLCAGAIVGLARLTYAYEDASSNGIAGQFSSKIPESIESRENLEELLTGSSISRAVVRVIDAIPADAFGLAPGRFATGLDMLKEVMDEAGAS